MRPTWIAAIGVVALAAGIAVYSADSIGPTGFTSGTSTSNDNSSSFGSSTSSNSSTTQSVSQYPLVWAPNSPSEGSCDTFPFCVYARLGFSGIATLPTPNQTSSATTIIQSNTTTLIQSSTTTYISGISTGVVYPPENGSYPVAVFALIQDVLTGQNFTMPGDEVPGISGGCDIQPTGFTTCIAGGGPVPPGHAYDVSVFVTKGDLPCSIRQAGANVPCESQLLAPIQTITVVEPSTSTSSSTSTAVASATTSFSSPDCSSPMNTLLDPAPKGTVYMKVVTDQGTGIVNGTLLVTQVGNFTGSWIGWGLMAHYCISLHDINGTGYLQLGGNETFLTSGYYNLTLITSYNNQGPWYNATIPSILVHPNSTIYVTVSVPSGVVTVVMANEASSAATTTTTTVTISKDSG